MSWWYRRIIPIYFLGIKIASYFRRDAKLWIDGRKDWKQKLAEFTNSIPVTNKLKIWIHAPSLGEFEQGRELIERIKTQQPETVLILSFFSPSGYEKQKAYKYADFVCYFPSDRIQDVCFFIDNINPSFVIFIKYDFWFNTLDYLKLKQIPFYFLSVVFRPSHYLLKAYSKSLLIKLKNAEQLFLQNKESYDLLTMRGFENIQITGDSRFDRVYRIAMEQKEIPKMEFFGVDKKIFIAGSIWDADIQKLQDGINHAISSGWKIILVPHLTDNKHLRYLENKFPVRTIRYSALTRKTDVPILIVDEIGLLSSLYRYGTLAYVGGGFGKGIHNILEPLSHGLVVCFGPNYHKFPEAIEALKNRIGFTFINSKEFITLFDQISETCLDVNKLIPEFIEKNIGASLKIYRTIFKEPQSK